MKKYQLIDINKLINSELCEYYAKEEIIGLRGLICEHILKTDPTKFISSPDAKIDKSVYQQIQTIVLKLKEHYPVQYLIGKVAFYNIELEITPDVLIPRPETEELVDLIVKDKPENKKIIDIGTGSGCIAIALKKNLDDTYVTAVDKYNNALEIAKRNALKNSVIINHFIHDILENKQLNCAYDIIVSNPPYVTESDKKHMKANVLDCEPAHALFVPDDNPLTYYKAIKRFADVNLKDGGFLYLEINEYLGNETRLLFESAAYEAIVIKDINKKDRFLKVKKK
jgi:release factor glutamine methyltransferase